MVDPVTSAAPAGATPATMTELQLTEAIESTLAAPRHPSGYLRHHPDRRLRARRRSVKARPFRGR